MLPALQVRLQNPDFLGAGCPLTPNFHGCGLMRGPESFTIDAPLGLVTPERPEVDPQSPMDGDTDRYTPLRPVGAAGERGEEQGCCSGSTGGEPTCLQLGRQHLPDVPPGPLSMAGAEGEEQ